MAKVVAVRSDDTWLWDAAEPMHDCRDTRAIIDCSPQPVKVLRPSVPPKPVDSAQLGWPPRLDLHQPAAAHCQRGRDVRGAGSRGPG
jgi:hypothetical protein